MCHAAFLRMLYLHAQTTVDIGHIHFWQTVVILLTERTEDPEFEPHAWIKMGQVLGISLVYSMDWPYTWTMKVSLFLDGCLSIRTVYWNFTPVMWLCWIIFVNYMVVFNMIGPFFLKLNNFGAEISPILFCFFFASYFCDRKCWILWGEVIIGKDSVFHNIICH